MSVPIEANSVTYTFEADKADYAIPFNFTDSSEIVVTINVTVCAEDDDYTVANSTVTFNSEFLTESVGADGDTLTIVREVPFTQPTDFSAASTFSPAAHELTFDEIVYQFQQLDRRLTELEEDDPGAVQAGAGLFYAGTTLHVGAGAGVGGDLDQMQLDYGTAGQMVTLSVTADASAGVLDKVTRVDHRHHVNTAAPVDGAVMCGNTASEGTATTLAKSDHIHAVATGTPVDVTKDTASEGTATTFARSDHLHDVSVDTAIEISDSSNLEGVASSLSRSDHVHAHGERGGGSLHALAINGGAAGFFSGTEKAELDDSPDILKDPDGTVTVTADWNHVVTYNVAPVQTTDATLTTCLSWAIGAHTTEVVKVCVAAYNDSDQNGAGYVYYITTKRETGAASIVGSGTTILEAEDDAGLAVTIAFSTVFMQVKVTGLADTNIFWKVRATRLIGRIP